MQCPRCQEQHPTSQNFCGGCGAPVSRPNTSGPPAASYADLQREVEQLARDLNEALGQQTATSEILRVISNSPTDVQPVFETIADSAMCLFGAVGVAVVRYDGELISMAAARGGAPGSAAAAAERSGPPIGPSRAFLQSKRCSRRRCTTSPISRQIDRVATSSDVTHTRGASARSFRCRCSEAVTPSGLSS